MAMGFKKEMNTNKANLQARCHAHRFAVHAAADILVQGAVNVCVIVMNFPKENECHIESFMVGPPYASPNAPKTAVLGHTLNIKYAYFYAGRICVTFTI